MKHFALVMGVLFLLLFASNGFCSGEETTQKVTDQAVEEGKAEVKEASEAQEQAKDTAEATEEKTEQAAEEGKAEVKEASETQEQAKETVEATKEKTEEAAEAAKEEAK